MQYNLLDRFVAFITKYQFWKKWVFVKSGNGSSCGSGGGSGSGNNDGTEALKRKQRRNVSVKTYAKSVRKCPNGSKNGTELPIKRDIEYILMKTPKTEFSMTGSPPTPDANKKYLGKLQVPGHLPFGHFSTKSHLDIFENAKMTWKEHWPCP